MGRGGSGVCGARRISLFCDTRSSAALFRSASTVTRAREAFCPQEQRTRSPRSFWGRGLSETVPGASSAVFAPEQQHFLVGADSSRQQPQVVSAAAVVQAQPTTGNPDQTMSGTIPQINSMRKSVYEVRIGQGIGRKEKEADNHGILGSPAWGVNLTFEAGSFGSQVVDGSSEELASSDLGTMFCSLVDVTGCA